MPNTDSSPNSNWIKLDDVGVSFQRGQSAVESLNLACDQGEFVSIVGPSGCGKSTVLRLIADLQKPTAGTVHRGWDDDGTNRIGFVFQQPNLLPWRNVLDNIAIPLELRGDSKTSRTSAARQARETVGLAADDEKKLPRMLSGGMQMRVSVARALVTQPKIMLMDEPFAAVDDLLRSRLNEELIALWQQQGWTTVFVTHHVHEAVFLSQRVLIMSPGPGKIVDDVKIDLPYPRPAGVRGSAEFAAITHDVMQRLHNSSETPQPGQAIRSRRNSK